LDGFEDGLSFGVQLGIDNTSNSITIGAKVLDRLFRQSTGGAEVTWPVPSQFVQLNVERVFETKNREQHVSFEVKNN
jgi:hypothetical protein